MRIVQFSDMHILAAVGDTCHGVDSFSSLNRGIGGVLALNPLPDFFFLTGDIAEDGVFESYLRVRSLFERIRIPVYAVPGNHDDFPIMSKAFANSCIHLKPSADLNDWTAIFLNSQVVGKSHGSLDRDALNGLEQSFLRAAGRPVIVSLHHPFISCCPSLSCQVNNASECLDLLKKYKNVKLVLAGHLHVADESQFGHISLLTTPSTFAGVTHPATAECLAEDFWSTHSLDTSQQGFRVVDLLPEGEVMSHVVWIKLAQ
ncbi:MAG: metallophosphoesterase [Proteobacteria bacterium]|nr:metallophosphoesterase [Pseudomonadota bacterium]